MGKKWEKNGKKIGNKNWDKIIFSSYLPHYFNLFNKLFIFNSILLIFLIKFGKIERRQFGFAFFIPIIWYFRN